MISVIKLYHLSYILSFWSKLNSFFKFLKLFKNLAEHPVLQYMVIGQISSKMTRWDFSIFITFSDIHIHVFMLFIKFELIPITFGFFTNFLSCSKIRSKSMYYSTGTLAKFHQKLKVENSPFYNFFWYIYMYLCCVESLSWFPSKLDFLRIFKIAPKSCQSPCTIVQGLWPNFTKNWK